MPELPEVEITVRLINEVAAGQTVGSAAALGINVLKTVTPSLDELTGQSIVQLSRRGKLIQIAFDGDLVLLVHLMTAGRLQWFDQSDKDDRATRLAIRFEGGSQLKLREFGKLQLAWAKLLPMSSLASEPSLVKLGPEAWPRQVDLRKRPGRSRTLHAWLRDQSVIAGIGRAWADDILHAAKLSPFQRVDQLSDDRLNDLQKSIVEVLDRAITAYEQTVRLPIPAKLAKPLHVHGRQGQPCVSCSDTLAAVHYSNYVISYCPDCQISGRTLKDRRRSKLLK